MEKMGSMRITTALRKQGSTKWSGFISFSIALVNMVLPDNSPTHDVFFD
jgi:hypothetical protein